MHRFFYDLLFQILYKKFNAKEQNLVYWELVSAYVCTMMQSWSSISRHKSVILTNFLIMLSVKHYQ